MSASASPTKPSHARAFAPGARLLVRDEEWIVNRATLASSGGTAVHVTGVSELVRNKKAIFLTDLDAIEELRPEQTAIVHDDSPRYRRARLYLDALLRKTPPTDARLYLGHRGALDVADYQLEPALKALAQPRARILIADAVGLGKTVEVGILLTELIRRGRGERILVVALKSILEQFQEELWARFTIPLVRLDSVGLQRVQRRIPANMNPFHYYPRAIISVDTLKKDVKYRRFLEACHWDTIVIDECQHVAVRTRGGGGQKSQRARLAGLLANTCDNLILTSATPHDGRPESFASLIELLDPTAIADPRRFTQADIEELYVRRFKKDVAAQAQGAFSEREIHIQHVAASAEEDALFGALESADFRTINVRGGAPVQLTIEGVRKPGRAALFRTLLVKGLLSSPAALAQTLTERLKHKDLQPDADGNLGENAAHDRALLDQLLSLCEAVTPERFAKLQQLVAHLEQIGLGKDSARRVVIFSERVATLELLERVLHKCFKLGKGGIAQFHGSLDDQKQQALVKDFGSERGKTRVLLASDAAAEGINLHHYCHHMVHFDIPWSLITLEQRNGRIDRYGQAHTPRIEYLATVPGLPGLRGDLAVLDRLVEKEDAAHRNLGDTAWLLNLHDPEAEAQHVLEGVAAHLPPEEIVPDTPATSSGGEDADPDAFFAELMAAAAAPPPEPPSAKVADAGVRLYEDELAFLREAFAELRVQDPKLSVELYDHLAGLRLSAPEDLKQRYQRLPSELARARAGDAVDRSGGRSGGTGELTFQLTTERSRVQRALEASRQDPKHWPEWELLWDQHPVVEWVNDRVLAHFGRHEAPVLRVPRGLSGQTAGLLMQGVISNERSQPVAVDWFVVSVAGPGAVAGIQSLSAFAAASGLDGELSNPALGFDTAALEAMRAAAVEAGRAHMAALRDQRAEDLRPALKERFRRLRDWRGAALEAVEAAERAAQVDGRRLRSDEERRLQARKQEADAVYEAAQRWVKLSLSTSPEPYFRIAAVFVGADFGTGVTSGGER